MKTLISALTILIQYGNPIIPFHYENEILYIVGIPPKNVSTEDKKELERLGIFVTTLHNILVFRASKFIL